MAALARPPYVKRALGAAGALAAFAAVLATGLVRCPTALLFGIPCPGCGTTRAARALLSLDVAGALRIQPLAPLVLVAFALLAARGVWLVARDGHARALGEGRFGRALVRLLVVAAALEVVVWALRWFGMFGGPVAV